MIDRDPPMRSARLTCVVCPQSRCGGGVSCVVKSEGNVFIVLNAHAVFAHMTTVLV